MKHGRNVVLSPLSGGNQLSASTLLVAEFPPRQGATTSDAHILFVLPCGANAFLQHARSRSAGNKGPIIAATLLAPYNKNGAHCSKFVEKKGSAAGAAQILSVKLSALGGNKNVFIWEITGVVNRVQ